MKAVPLVCSLATLSLSHLFAAPTREAFAKEERPIESVPVEAFELANDDLKIEVWAQSPQIYSPVAMDCDAQGRLWVTEGIDYSQRARVDAGQSIIVLEDKDRDGRADSSHVFVTEKVRPAPLGIAVFDNRIVLSATPSIIVYTDVNRNAVFEPEIDKREEFLTGFHRDKHDHTLHAVVGAPSGQWHFSFGNCGADIKTVDGRHIVAGCYYGNSQAIGKPSSDGHVYVAGMSLRINPDGTGLEVTGENMRNPHDMFVSSLGDVFQSDNDDPAHCRSSWVMEYGNMGYADLRDGSRSWEEVAKSWEEPAGWEKNLRYSRSHWRENYPGSCPPGSVYGAGSPTGNVYLEDDALGLAGTYLVSCMVRKEVMACRPKLKDAHLAMGKHQPFVSLKKDEKGRHFLPTDVILGTDGSLFLSDFYNDTSRRTNQVSGTIYRITKKSAPKKMVLPTIDFTTAQGATDALLSSAVNVRSHAVTKLVEHNDPKPVLAFLKEHRDNRTLAARALWVLAQMGPQAAKEVALFLQHTDPQLRIVAFRALRHGTLEAILGPASVLAADRSPAVRREVALALRDVPYKKCQPILENLFAGYEGKDRYYLEALGTAVTGKEKGAYRDFVATVHGSPAKWNKVAKQLAWRLHTPEAIAALDECIRAQEPDIEEFRHLAMAFASFRNDKERVDRRKRLTELAELPAFKAEPYQITVAEILSKDLHDLKGESLTASYPVPTDFGTPSNVSQAPVIAKLKGDAARGKLQAGRCYMCHKMEGNGVAFGPDLTHWGKQRTIEEIVKEIVDPDAKLAHGYDQPVRLRKGNHVAEGMLSNFSWHAGNLKVKLMGGVTKKIDFRKGGVKVQNLTESWMPSASEMGFSDQDVRDIAEFLKTLGGPTQVAKDEPKLNKGEGEGWVQLKGEDFLNVNSYTDTWRWKDGHAYCTGKPTGVIRYKEPLTNFEFVCEWMHKKKGGNSGVFLWASPQSLRNCAAGRARLPHGIEVQVLDIGYREVYEKQFNKPGNWFTSHGDVFTVGPVKMNPFPPVGPRGRRSFPSQKTTKGIYQWNHYYVRAVDGEVRLWVNGVEVSGGDAISPAKGWLCLESEGAPVEFRNIRLKKLAPLETKMEDDAEIPVPVLTGPRAPTKQPTVTLEGHPILGTWKYLDTYTREFTKDGFCVLRNNDEVIWKRRCVSKSAKGLVLEGSLGHTLDGDKLQIEGRYTATRAK